MKEHFLPILASNKTCTGCLACVDTCSKTNALSFNLESDGHWYPSVDASKCIGCHLCEKSCPVISNLQYSKSTFSEFFSCWNKDLVTRKRSATAGAFSAIASYILDRGGVVIGASLEDICNIKHIAITDKKDLYKLQGSKYSQSDTSGIYKMTLDFLQKERTVLFSGTGCQVAGLYSYLAKKKYRGRLITIDLICGGVPSKHLLKKFIDNEPYKIKRILSFRSKDNGWSPHGFIYNLKTEDVDGRIHDYTGKRNLLTDAFCSELTNRYSCYQCIFAGENRMSDFTIGDFWGAKEYPEQHNNGLSLIIAHNRNSIELLSTLKEYLEFNATNKNIAIASNYRIKKTKSKQGLMLERKFLPWIINHCSYQTIKKIYAWDYGKYSPWMLLKLYQKTLTKILK